MGLDLAELWKVAASFPPPPGVQFSYGTAGFRTNASLLVSTVFRTGVLAALRSLRTGAVTGLVITASHNPILDNGVKVADPSGGMLTMDWEIYADELANARNVDSFLTVVKRLIESEGIQSAGPSKGKVLLARDTRPSGAALCAAARKGIEAVAGVVAEDLGLLTTPQLHWMVRATNIEQDSSELHYYDVLSDAFRTLLELGPSRNYSSGRLIVDGANGIGGRKIFELQHRIRSLDLDIRNTGRLEEGLLNDNVGADYVQKERKLPRNFDVSKDVGIRCVSIDGDADRLVYFYIGCKSCGDCPSLCLLDGDKIMTLFASFIKDQLCALAMKKASDDSYGALSVAGYGLVKFGVVQTAYANGASTEYLKRKVGVPVLLTPTGVKHLHEKAAAYDIGIYFEANGHGTILMKKGFLEWLKIYGTAEKGVQGQAALRLIAVSEMVNQAVGDALGGLLMVEAILHYQNLSVQQWDSLYIDLPSKQLKVKVKDRSLIATTAVETVVVSPKKLQDALDSEIAKYKMGRAFVRPSGTEDVVRVYAEAVDQNSADALAKTVAMHVYREAGGVGPEP